MPNTCPCEYAGLDDEGRVQWNTEHCPDHRPKSDSYFNASEVPSDQPS